jgi:FixJ family two-component response regulator
MAVMSGLDLQRRLSAGRQKVPMIFITGRDDPAARAQALKSGAIDYLKKPFAADALLGAIQAAIGKNGDR